MSPRAPKSEDEEPVEPPKRKRSQSSPGERPNKRATSSRLKPVDPGKADRRRATVPLRKVKSGNQPSLGSKLLRVIAAIGRVLFRGLRNAIILGIRFGRWATPRLWARAKTLSPFAWIGIVLLCSLLAGGTFKVLQPGPTATPTPPVISPFFPPSFQHC